ncbi:MAG: hypothetical protein PHQ95_04440 [Candidatus Gracilibacteria bacterium]|nr:hypothetical protein [Candidatus Gracilibacteria bacterium]
MDYIFNLISHIHLNPETFLFFSEMDKIKHMSLSATILIFDFIVRFFFIQKKQNGTLALTLAIRDTLLIGVTKEIFDMLGMGTPDLRDLSADILGFLFPIYIYLVYLDGRKLKDDDLLNYSDDAFRELRNKTKHFKKEFSEGLHSSFGYSWSKTIDYFIPTSFTDFEMAVKKRMKQKEMSEGKYSLSRLLKTIKYFFIFLFYAIIEFFIDLFKMPFFIIGKTLYLFFNSMTFILRRFE